MSRDNATLLDIAKAARLVLEFKQDENFLLVSLWFY